MAGYLNGTSAKRLASENQGQGGTDLFGVFISVTLDLTVQKPGWLVYRVQTGSLHEVYTRFTASLYGVYIWNTPGTQTVHRIGGRLQNQKLEFRS